MQGKKLDRLSYKDWELFEKKYMTSEPFTVQSLVNKTHFSRTMIDTGCLCYGIINERLVRQLKCERIPIRPRSVKGIQGKPGTITEVVRLSIDIDGHCEKGAYLYVMTQTLDYDMILGRPWMKRWEALIDPSCDELEFKFTGLRTRNTSKPSYGTKFDHALVSAAAFGAAVRREKKEHLPTSRSASYEVPIFAASMADIEKALAPKMHLDPRTKLPEHYHEFLKLFDKKEADRLPPFRGEGMDHRIELIKGPDGKDPVVPYGPLYNMSREELLVLRRELTTLLDKGFIRVSHSSAAAPVLFVRKPGGGLRFCVDYRALNAITKKDRYPLPLIHETLNHISRAKWFTKLDVTAAFWKLRIAKGDEWMTAFRTRYGLYEWLVTPFGMANAPSTFQKYINWALREYLDEFCSAYVDNILIYTDGTIDEHRDHVRKVFSKLTEAGLQLDIGKCEFEVYRTKYLGYIIETGKGISMDPEKVKAIAEWEAPRTVKGVRGFLGFANFYRTFIRDYSEVVMPLVRLTKKDTAFKWDDSANAAFEKLKTMFTTAPVLAQFDPDRTTVLEADSSGYVTGDVLSQYDDDGTLRPCAYFSQKSSPAECNYEIHDKEMLAVIKCLNQWDSELRSVREFEVITDHKNLEYFMKPRQLGERHVRWRMILERYNLRFHYRPGKLNVLADALSRREQDLPSDATDERLQSRYFQFLQTEGPTIAPVLADDVPLDVALYEDAVEAL